MLQKRSSDIMFIFEPQYHTLVTFFKLAHTCNLIFAIRIIAFFYLALIHLLKFKRRQGKASVILLVIKFLKTISKDFFDK